MICLSICGHHFESVFLQVKARLAQAWQAINKLPACEGESFYISSDFNFSLRSELLTL